MVSFRSDYCVNDSLSVLTGDAMCSRLPDIRLLKLEHSNGWIRLIASVMKHEHGIVSQTKVFKSCKWCLVPKQVSVQTKLPQKLQ